MTPTCIGEPVSWLRLERYRLGELGESDRQRIAAHLAACPACATCAARIDADDAVDLPPLERRPAPAPPRPIFSARRLLARTTALAAAAATVLAFGHAWRGPEPGARTAERFAVAGDRAKGGEVAFTLVRDDGVRLLEARGRFDDGDRFKALVTCPPSMRAAFDLVVYDADGASFPVEPAPELACGNEVPLGGAFRLTGPGPEVVCLVWNEGRVDRDALSAKDPAELTQASCKELAGTR
jgi:hypothetical protein